MYVILSTLSVLSQIRTVIDLIIVIKNKTNIAHFKYIRSTIIMIVLTFILSFYNESIFGIYSMTILFFLYLLFGDVKYLFETRFKWNEEIYKEFYGDGNGK